MKLLIVTQVLDSEHPVLGFFHRWAQEFATHYDHVHVVCLQRGLVSLPHNVTVHSLGKEKIVTPGGATLEKDERKGWTSGTEFGRILRRFRYTFRFYQVIWSLRHDYDDVFVHMNQIYVILGALMWRVLGKQIGLWYAHGAVSNTLRAAVGLVHIVFTSTPEGLRIDTRKRSVVGQGIDGVHFQFREREISPVLRLGTVGRVSRSKNLTTLVDVCALLRKEDIPFTFTLVGAPLTAQDCQYAEELRVLVKEHCLEDVVFWKGAIPQTGLPASLYEIDVFIHDGVTQSLDKALLEAVMCGCVVASSNLAYGALAEAYTPEFLFQSGDASALAEIICKIAHMSPKDRRVRMAHLREMVYREHSVEQLIGKIARTY